MACTGTACSPRQTPTAEPTSLSSGASATPDETALTEPGTAPRRKLRSFAIRRRCRLPQLPGDAWDAMLSHAAARPLSLILLMMTCKGIRDLIRDNHKLWRRLYVEWEGRYCAGHPRCSLYVRPVPNALFYLVRGQVWAPHRIPGQPSESPPPRRQCVLD